MRFADVAGIDGIKDEIKVVMDMLLGAEEYIAIGAQPFRVRIRLEEQKSGAESIPPIMSKLGEVPQENAAKRQGVQSYRRAAFQRVQGLSVPTFTSVTCSHKCKRSGCTESLGSRALGTQEGQG